MNTTWPNTFMSHYFCAPRCPNPLDCETMRPFPGRWFGYKVPHRGFTELAMPKPKIRIQPEALKPKGPKPYLQLTLHGCKISPKFCDSFNGHSRGPLQAPTANHLSSQTLHSRSGASQSASRSSWTDEYICSFGAISSIF